MAWRWRRICAGVGEGAARALTHKPHGWLCGNARIGSLVCGWAGEHYGGRMEGGRSSCEGMPAVSGAYPSGERRRAAPEPVHDCQAQAPFFARFGVQAIECQRIQPAERREQITRCLAQIA